MSIMITKYSEFDKINESTEDIIKNLLNKVKKLVPKSTIKQFIEDNHEEVEKVQAMLTTNGKLDYSKIANFLRSR